jgi:dTDP-4-dehydrorhamnose reductase
MTVLVLGASGQLARHLREFMPEATYLGRDSFDLTRPTGLSEAIEAVAPSAIINAAAYTAVDKAESERDLAWRINAEAVAVAARTATGLNVPLLHVSTDYVFDGEKKGGYLVDDPVRPINAYGMSKLGGELATRLLSPQSWILRTSWLFSEHGTNFVKTMLRLGSAHDALTVVADQYGRPTYARDLARLIVEIVVSKDSEDRLPFGTYHAVGGPVVSWHGFAEAIFELALKSHLLARRPLVTPIPASEYPTAARRPANSALEPSREIEDCFGLRFDWRSGLARTLQRLEPPPIR